MGEVLATFHFNPDAKQWTPRSYVKEVALGWLPGVTFVSTVNPYIYLEHTFGGYQVFLRLRSNYHLWSSNTYSLDYPIEDLYAIEPVTGNHVALGLVEVGLGFDATHPSSVLTYGLSGTSDYYFQTLPAAPSGYWLNPLP
jgi:hypothetical protein